MHLTHPVRALVGALATAAGLVAVPPARAQESPHTFEANVGLYSQYVFRGLAQTFENPALQGGFDWSHASGFYVGTWASNISWLSDVEPDVSASLEIDVYAGFARELDNGFSYDVGVLRYQYPGEYPTGFVKPHTTELYAGVGWKWATLKYSYAVTDTFGFADSKGSDYLDLTLGIPVGEAITIDLHYGRQTFGGRGNDVFDYDDWKLGATWAFGTGWSLSVAYTDTDAEAALFTVRDKNLADSQFVIGLSRSF